MCVFFNPFSISGLSCKTHCIISFLFACAFSLAQNPTEINKFLFEPGIVSTVNVEYSATFSRDGREAYFARSEQEWGSGAMKSTLYCSTFDGKKWSMPKVLSFSGEYDDSDPHITADGKTLYFISDRPSTKATSPDIWMVKRIDRNTWGKPVHLPYPINSDQSEYSPSTDDAGNLYFASTRPGGYGQGDLYVSRNVNGTLEAPTNMGNTLNGANGEWNLEISNDGNMVLFEASGRKQNVSSYGDIYISFKKNGEWTIPQNVRELNTSGSDLYPFWAENTGQLFFSSSDSLKSKDTNIYKIAIKTIMEKYRKTAKIPSQN